MITLSARFPQVATTLDLDQDGDQDLVVAMGGPATLALFENLENVDFGPQKTLTSSPVEVSQLEAFDLDQDGWTDLVFLARLDDIMGWMKNNGDGTFQAVDTLLSIDNPRSFDLGDLDGDMDPDIAISAGIGESRILENVGSSIFELYPTPVDTLSSSGIVQLADMDLDGDLDLVALNGAGTELNWAENDGIALSWIVHDYAIGTVAGPVFEFYMADIDLDGDPDPVMGLDDQGVMWMANDGTGVLSDEALLSSSSTSIRSMDLFDVDVDGDLDLLIDYSGEHVVNWEENLGDGNFQIAQQLDSIGSWINFLFHGDINGDDHPDLILLNQVQGRVMLYPNEAGGQLGDPYTITSTSENVRAIRAYDVDSDGDMDLISASRDDDNLGYHENLGEGTFARSRVINPAGYTNMSIDLGDIDGDGDIDLLSSSDLPAGEVMHWYEKGPEGFAEEGIIIPHPGTYVTIARLADMDMDGDLDVVASSSSSNEITLHLNEGTGLFSDPLVLGSYDIGPRCLHLQDMDSDGDIDIVIAESSSSADEVLWIENSGAGEFAISHLIADDAWGARDLEVVDIDGDGDLDVLTASTYIDDKVNLYLNLGEEEFSGAIPFSSSEGIVDHQVVSIGDADLDGDLDVFFTNETNEAIYMVEQIAPALFGPPIQVDDRTPDSSDLLIEDIDGDGYADLISAFRLYGGEIAMHHNELGLGCMDPSACNYNPAASQDDGSCCYADCGCTVLGAENYDPAAICDDGSCGFLVLGKVFFDENENGIMDSTESPLAGRQVLFSPEGNIVTSNENGEFFVQASTSDSYIFTAYTDEDFPYITTEDPLVFEADQDNWNSEVRIGLSDETPQFGLEVDQYREGETFLCNAARRFDLCFVNSGTVPIEGHLAFTYDDLFQSHVEVTPIDSVIDGALYYGFESLVPGESSCVQVELVTPTVDFIGDSIWTNVQVVGIYEEMNVAFGNDTLTTIHGCAYDPNDKQVFPSGYSEEHYVHPDSTLEYLVRFQNTGNAPATDVIIRDTIDDNLDLSTFELLANSHSVFTTLRPEDREVEFYFQDIQLPDSVANEPESHGMVSYRIRPTQGTALLTELNNTAHIFFDNNPPVVTNTTWSTLYDCSLFEVNFTDDGALLTASEGDSYQWFLDGELIDGAIEQEYLAQVTGDYSVEVGIDFPCSDISTSTFVVVSSIAELANSQILLFPNPMTTSAVIDLGELNGTVTLDVYDLSGKLIRTQQQTTNSGQLRLERGDLASGSYLLRVISGQEAIEVPFVVK